MFKPSELPPPKIHCGNIQGYESCVFMMTDFQFKNNMWHIQFQLNNNNNMWRFQFPQCLLK